MRAGVGVVAVLEAFAVNVIDNRLYPVGVFSLWASRALSAPISDSFLEGSLQYRIDLHVATAVAHNGAGVSTRPPAAISV